MWVARIARLERKRLTYLALSFVWLVGQQRERERERAESRGIALQPQPTWIREMGNANPIGAS